MQLDANEKKYFLQKSGRIIGPLSMLRLNAMFREGSLNSECLYSETREQWFHIYALFPELKPAEPAPEKADVPLHRTATVKEETSGSNAVPAAVNSAEEKNLELQPEDPAHPVAVWCFDIARTIALLWNFQEMQKYRVKYWRFYGIATALNLIWGIVIVLIFGKYYSTRFHCFFSPLMGMSLLVFLLGAASLIGWGAAKYCVPAGEKVRPSWKVCAAGIFMNYGTFSCCVMALAHGVWHHLWVLIFLFFINSFTVYSCSMLLRDYLELRGKAWKIWSIGFVLLANPILAAIVYCFTKLI